MMRLFTQNPKPLTRAGSSLKSLRLFLPLALAAFALLPSSSIAATTERASVDSAEAQANAHSSLPSISTNGRFVAFQSDASNLVTGDTNEASDIFVRDLSLGTTVRVSLSSDGDQGNAHSVDPDISADGRYVVFESGATNLVAKDLNEASDVFLRDRDTDADGLFDEPGAVVTNRLSVTTGGVEGNAPSGAPAIDDYEVQRYVAFHSLASNLVADDTNGVFDVFVRDRDTDEDSILDEPGAVSTTRISVNESGSEGNGNSLFPDVSRGGTVFESAATNLVNDDTNGVKDIYYIDIPGIQGPSQLVRVSVSNDLQQADGPSDSAGYHNRYARIVFRSEASNLVAADTNSMSDIFITSPCAGLGECTYYGFPERWSVGTTGVEANGPSFAPVVHDGDYGGPWVAFHSNATNLVPNDTNSYSDVFIRDHAYPSMIDYTVRVSVTGENFQAHGGGSFAPVMGYGGVIAFESDATNLVGGDTNSARDVFVRALDSDNDGVLEPQDNCPNVYNPYQTDTDGDGIGDDCDLLPTFNVDSTGDLPDLMPGDGKCEASGVVCTLRAAIEEANATAGKDEIAFNIPGQGPYVIKPLTALPPITEAVIIDGTTQPGFEVSPVIQLEGSGINPELHPSGLVVIAGDSTIKGLIITRFGGNGIHVLGDSNQVLGDIIGGTSIVRPMDNRGHGVLVSGSNNLIGGTGTGERNIIGSNGQSLVMVDCSGIESCTGNAILNYGAPPPSAMNYNYNFGIIGIDLGPAAGVTLNDLGDFDQGPNGLQNFPELLFANVDALNTTVSVKLNSSASTLFAVDFFSTPFCNFTGYGEGTIVLGSTTVQTDASGNVNFVYEVPNLGQVKAGDFITATATDPLNNTSEFSQCLILACAPEFNPGIDTDLDGVGDYCDLDDDDDSKIGSGNTTRVASAGPCPTGGAAHPIFGDCVELFIGTDPMLACAATPTKNDEPVDPYPLDVNDDGFVDIIGDISVVTGHFDEAPTPANVRYDFTSDGFIDVIGDIVLMTSRFDTTCAPSGSQGVPFSTSTSSNNPLR